MLNLGLSVLERSGAIFRAALKWHAARLEVIQLERVRASFTCTKESPAHREGAGIMGGHREGDPPCWRTDVEYAPGDVGRLDFAKWCVPCQARQGVHEELVACVRRRGAYERALQRACARALAPGPVPDVPPETGPPEAAGDVADASEDRPPGPRFVEAARAYCRAAERLTELRRAVACGCEHEDQDTPRCSAAESDLPPASWCATCRQFAGQRSEYGATRAELRKAERRMRYSWRVTERTP